MDTPDDRTVDTSGNTGALAETGSDSAGLLAVGSAAVALLAGGSLLYRRGTAVARR
ncbi:LPXTG cell wall anchor domain-containing protein [Streptomyces sp. NPDC059909]|uniref:LPXTG cell wall anchor domain-containing protein n=1 Tax=Streptomyces sp. NPDC059909 TaxID=3346998 RepID=UPI00364CAD2F